MADLDPTASKEIERYDAEDTAILREAKERFKRARDYEANWRTLAILDMKFAMGDSDNGWQWPDDIKKGRDANKRPNLTINKTGGIVRDIVNKGRQNRPGMKIEAVGGQASYQSARLYQGLIRSIENESNAQSIYDEALRDSVECGAAYWRVTTSYYDEESFDQSIRLIPIPNVLSCLVDPDCKEKDSSDAMYAFLYDDMPRKEFERQFPEIDLPPLSQSTGLDETEDWIQTNSVRIAEYYRIVVEEDQLMELTEKEGVATFRRSQMPPRFRELIREIEAKNDPDKILKKRSLKTSKLEWFKIMGSKIVERRTRTDKPLKGKYIPVIKVPGRERIIEGRLERKGLVRDLKDPQRMYNYNSSGEVEVVALQTKTPWVVSAEAIEGNETQWNNANTQNAAALVWKAYTEEGNAVPPPARIDPPTPSTAFMEGMRIAAAELEMVSGIAQAQQVNPALERTPKAIDERTFKGDVAVQDFYDNLGLAICHCARVIIDIAPYIYDTKRVVKIMAEDGDFTDITIDPQMNEAHKEQKDAESDTIKVFFNPSVGRYAILPDVGPSYMTRRKEAWNAFSQILMANEALTGLIGDIAFRNADFEGAELIAERMRKALRQQQPWLFDEGPAPEVLKLRQELEKAIKDNAELMEKFTHERLKSTGKDELRDIEWYSAQTDRLTAEGNAVSDLAQLDATGGLKVLIRQTIAEMMGFSQDTVEAADRQARMNGGGEAAGNAEGQAAAS